MDYLLGVYSTRVVLSYDLVLYNMWICGEISGKV